MAFNMQLHITGFAINGPTIIICTLLWHSVHCAQMNDFFYSVGDGYQRSLTANTFLRLPCVNLETGIYEIKCKRKKEHRPGTDLFQA